jgi:3-oxoadipate enol-lactonase
MTVDVAHRFDGPEDAPGLMMSNSLGTAMDMWEDQMPVLRKHFRVLRYDQRGHGETPATPGPYTLEELSADAIALLDRLGLERVSFLGASMGGMTGMWIAINLPERIERLVLCCTSAHIPPPERWRERAALVRERGMEAVAEASLERWFTPALRNRRSEVVAQLEGDLLAIDPEGYAGCCEAISKHDLRDRLAEIAAPSLVITAAEDPSIDPEQGEQIAARVPDARLLALPEGRHLVNIELPKQVNAALLEHLSGAAKSG